jgi:hypothetical protein
MTNKETLEMILKALADLEMATRRLELDNNYLNLCCDMAVQAFIVGQDLKEKL